MRKLAAICWVLGLSLQGVGVVLSGIGVRLSHMSVWRDIQEQAAMLEKRRRWQGVRMLGVDGLYPLRWGEKQAVLIAVNNAVKDALPHSGWWQIPAGSVGCIAVGRVRGYVLSGYRGGGIPCHLFFSGIYPPYMLQTLLDCLIDLRPSRLFKCLISCPNMR